MSTSAVFTTVIIVFILLRRAIVVNIFIWIIPLPLFEQMVNKFRKMKVMFLKKSVIGFVERCGEIFKQT
jgi:hypothetical protein